MAEVLKFKNFNVETDSVHDIGAVPGIEDDPGRPGVIGEIKAAFGYEGDDLGELIGAVAPEKTLQANIAHAVETLGQPEVRERIGYADESAVDVARDWGLRSGLQEGVLRPLMNPADEVPKDFAAAIVTDAVANWMKRMADIAKSVASQSHVERLLLVAGGREIGATETHLVPGGTTIPEYMRQEIIPAYGISRGPTLFNSVEIIETDKKDGGSVMGRAAEHLDMLDGVDLKDDLIVVPAVAGNWMQKGVQARQALQAVQEGFDENPEARQLWVASHFFPLGFTGKEHKGSYQNPFSAIGNILRGAKLLDEQK